MVRFLISKPTSVIVIFVALILLGGFSAFKIPVGSLPNVAIPEISVRVFKNGISAEEFEKSITGKLKIQLQQIDGLANLETETNDGQGILKLKFNYGTNIDYAFLEVNEKIDLAMNSLPRDVARPRVVKASITDLPVFYISLHLSDSTFSKNNPDKQLELSEFAESVVKRRLEQLPEIAFADVTGLVSSEIFITPRQETIKTLKITEAELKKIIAANNLSYQSISVMDGIFRYNIKMESSGVSNIDDIRNITFLHDNRLLKLSDIADIGQRITDQKGGFVNKGKEAINFAIIKQPEARLSDLENAVERQIKQFRKEVPDVIFEQSRDQAALLAYSISNLKQDLLAGSFLAFILMIFFLRNIRSATLIAITVPTCLLLSILTFYFIGLTINIISLSGLVLGVGLMIDNTIIVIDNIDQFRKMGKSTFDACVVGTADIMKPLVASGLITCSVFLPLIFLSGIAGALFYDEAVAISIGLFYSLTVSITLLPTLYLLFNKGEINAGADDVRKPKSVTLLENLYEKGFHWVFDNKIKALLVVAILVISNIFLFSRLKKEKLPAFEDTELIIKYDWNENLTFPESKKRIAALMKVVSPYVSQATAEIGQQQYLINHGREMSGSEAIVYIKADTKEHLGLLKVLLGHFNLTNYPNATTDMHAPPNAIEQVFGQNDADLIVKIYPADGGFPVAKILKEKIKILVTRRFPLSQITEDPVQQVKIINTLKEKMLAAGITEASLFSQIETALKSEEIGGLIPTEQKRIMLGNQVYQWRDFLNNYKATSDRGGMVALNTLIAVKDSLGLKLIRGDRNGNFMSMNITAGGPQEIQSYLTENLTSVDLAKIQFDGAFYSNSQMIREMLVVLFVSVMLLYFILAAQFESLIQPLIVILELPISLCGAMILLYCFNSSINLISLIGLIVMCGIIINDSVLKIDTVNQLIRKQGYPLKDAIHKAGLMRLKSIIMTASTTILSVAPFIFGADMGSTLQKPLSLALIGGMIIGTPVSLYFIPLIYWFYYKKFNRSIATNL